MALESSDDALRDPRCLASVDALVIDGANGVCREARLGDRGAWREGAGLAALGVLVALVAARMPTRARGYVAAAGLAALLLAALPGWRALSVERADAPWRVRATAAQVATRLEALTQLAREHRGCVALEGPGCEACAPLVRYALPVRRSARECPVLARASLGAASVTEPCARTGPHALRCERGPRAPRAARP